MPLVNFFIVGAAKCGTTSLHAYLSQHPDVFMSVPKEPRHFDVDLPAMTGWCIRDRAEYEALFEGAVGKKIIGEASPSYLLSERAATGIKSYNPDARILISIRNPVDFMFSLHRQFVSSCNEDLHDFRVALAAEAQRAKGEGTPRDAHYPAQLLYRKNARFSEQIERYLDAFGADRVKVILLDDLRENPDGVYRELVDFLGIEPHQSVDLAPKNLGEQKKIRNFGVRRWLKRNPVALSVIDRLPTGLRARVGDALQVFTRDRVDATVKIDPALREELIAEFAPEVQRLERLLGRDLSGWLPSTSGAEPAGRPGDP